MFLISGVAFSKSDLRAREDLNYTFSLYLSQSQNIIEVSNLGAVCCKFSRLDYMVTIDDSRSKSDVL